MGRGFWNTLLFTAGAIGGWKLKDKWDGPARQPSSMLGQASKALDIVCRTLFSDDDDDEKEGGRGDKRRIRELEETIVQMQEDKRKDSKEMQKVLDRLDAVEGKTNGPSYQHQFPTELPPQATTTTRRL